MTDLLPLITRSDGKLNSRTLNVEYFAKHDKMHLWQQLLDSTEDFDHLDIRWRAQALLAGQTECPRCSCGNKVQTADGKLSEFCSKACATKSPKKGENRRKVDETVAAAKRKATMIANHGVEFNSQRAEVKQIIRESQTKAHAGAWLRLADKEWLLEQHHTLGKSVKQVAKELRIDYGVVLDVYQDMEAVVHRTYNKSTAHITLSDWLRMLGIEVHDDFTPGWKSKQQLDIWLPDYSLAIEINGVRYHGDQDHVNAKAKPKSYHLTKTNRALEQGITLLQFTDVQCYLKEDIVKSLILSKLGMSSKLFARKCLKKRITWQESSTFLERNHIHGAGKATKECWGLFYNDELVQVLTLGKARYKHTQGTEVYRLCSKTGLSVTGGLSKLMSHVTGSVMTFVDRWIGDGRGFAAVGFQQTGATEPGYFWAKSSRTLNRERTQKSKLAALLKDRFNPELSETDNMLANGYWRVWNSGNLVMVKEA